MSWLDSHPSLVVLASSVFHWRAIAWRVRMLRDDVRALRSWAADLGRGVRYQRAPPEIR